MSSAPSKSSSGNSSSSFRSAYDRTGFLDRPDALPLDAGVAVLEAFAVFFGVALGVSAAFLLTGSVRLGLLEEPKNADVVVSSSSGVGSRFAFLGAGFFGVAFLGLDLVSSCCLASLDFLTPLPPRRRPNRQ